MCDHKCFLLDGTVADPQAAIYPRVVSAVLNDGIATAETPSPYARSEGAGSLGWRVGVEIASKGSIYFGSASTLK